ncbi:hypothetical protein K0W35_004462 [Vibrio parahaemolyticus]|nr:hypothetical protein [Vibrio parahaemolyticus]
MNTNTHDNAPDMSRQSHTIALRRREVDKALRLTKHVLRNPKLTPLILALTQHCQTHQQSPETALITLLQGKNDELS